MSELVWKRRWHHAAHLYRGDEKLCPNKAVTAELGQKSSPVEVTARGIPFGTTCQQCLGVWNRLHGVRRACIWIDDGVPCTEPLPFPGAKGHGQLCDKHVAAELALRQAKLAASQRPPPTLSDIDRALSPRR